MFEAEPFQRLIYGLQEPFFTIARKSNSSPRAQRVLHHARQGVLHREAEPRQRLSHGLESRFSTLLARANLHHERSEFFTTATPFFTVRQSRASGSRTYPSKTCPFGQVKLLAERAVVNEIAPLVRGSV